MPPISKTPTSGKSVREEELETMIIRQEEEIKSLESNNYIQRLNEETFFRLELLRAITRLTEAVDNLPQKVMDLQSPTVPTGE